MASKKSPIYCVAAIFQVLDIYIVSHLKNHYALDIEIFTYPSETYIMAFYEVIIQNNITIFVVWANIILEVAKSPAAILRPKAKDSGKP